MQFSILAIAASSLAVATAQSLGDIPSCAIPCFVAAIPSSGCALADQKCQCTTGQDAINKSIAQCIPSKCSASEIAAIAPAAAKLCQAAGVTLTNLPSGTPAASSAASSAAASGSAAASSAAASGSAKVSSALASASAAASSATSASRNATLSATQTPPTSTGGAVANAVNIGAVVAGLAVLAL